VLISIYPSSIVCAIALAEFDFRQFFFITSFAQNFTHKPTKKTPLQASFSLNQQDVEIVIRLVFSGIPLEFHRISDLFFIHKSSFAEKA